MADAVDDLLALDRDVARGVAALGAWREAMAVDPAAHAEDAPLEAVRLVAGQSTWRALGATAPSAVDVPLRDALREWVVVLLGARIGQPTEASEARALADPAGHFDGEPPRAVAWREAWRGVVLARTPGEARLWLDAAAGAGPGVAAASKERRAVRVELARRLGVDHPWQTRVPAPPAALLQAAGRLLDATEDLARAAWKDARVTGGPADRLHAAVAREAGEGWPAHLTPRWLEETFGLASRGAGVVLPRLPAALGASSYVRAMRSFGAALRTAWVPRAIPFCLGHEPGGRAAHRLGFAVASLATEVEWQVRTLGVGKRAAQAQARTLARTALLDARLDAARLLLDVDPADRFDELGERVLGGPLDRRLRGAWPAARDDEPARFVARLEGLRLASALRERFEVDWYRDARAWAHVREGSAAAARDPVDAATLDAGVEALARAFEGALA